MASYLYWQKKTIAEGGHFFDYPCFTDSKISFFLIGVTSKYFTDYFFHVKIDLLGYKCEKLNFKITTRLLFIFDRYYLKHSP